MFPDRGSYAGFNAHRYSALVSLRPQTVALYFTGSFSGQELQSGRGNKKPRDFRGFFSRVLRDGQSSASASISRFLRNFGAMIMSSNANATSNIPKLMGRVKKTVASPREINMARRRFSSINGPST